MCADSSISKRNEYKKYRNEVKRVGVNINQIARALNRLLYRLDDFKKKSESQVFSLGYALDTKNQPTTEVGIFVHGNTDNVHCHILVHSVSIENGRKLQLKKDALSGLKQAAGEICQEYGIGLRIQR